MWPDKFIIVDDTDNYKFVENALQDLRWVNDFVSWLNDKTLSPLDDEGCIKRVSDSIKSLPNEVKELAKSKPCFFRDLVVSIKIKEENDIARAKGELTAPVPGIAFIDLSVTKIKQPFFPVHSSTYIHQERTYCSYPAL